MAHRHTRGGIITAFTGIGLILLGFNLTPVLTGMGLLVTCIGAGIFVADYWLPQPLAPQEIAGIVSAFAGAGLTLLGLYLTPVLAGVGLLVTAIGSGILIAFHFFPSKK